MLQTLLKDAAMKRGLSSRQLALEIGVSHTTILRALRGEMVDLETILGIAQWLNVRPADLVNSLDRSEGSINASIAVLVERYPELGGVLRKAATAVRDGQASPDIIQDIVSYATYKINMAERTVAEHHAEGRRGRAAKGGG